MERSATTTAAKQNPPPQAPARPVKKLSPIDGTIQWVVKRTQLMKKLLGHGAHPLDWASTHHQCRRPVMRNVRKSGRAALVVTDSHLNKEGLQHGRQLPDAHVT